MTWYSAPFRCRVAGTLTAFRIRPLSPRRCSRTNRRATRTARCCRPSPTRRMWRTAFASRRRILDIARPHPAGLPVPRTDARRLYSGIRISAYPIFILSNVGRAVDPVLYKTVSAALGRRVFADDRPHALLSRAGSTGPVPAHRTDNLVAFVFYQPREPAKRALLARPKILYRGVLFRGRRDGACVGSHSSPV